MRKLAGVTLLAAMLTAATQAIVFAPFVDLGCPPVHSHGVPANFGYAPATDLLFDEVPLGLVMPGYEWNEQDLIYFNEVY